MVQIIQKKEREPIGQAFGEAIIGYHEGKERKKSLSDSLAAENKFYKENFGVDMSGITDPEQRKSIGQELMKNKGKADLFEKKQEFVNKIIGKDQQLLDDGFSDQIMQEQPLESQEQGPKQAERKKFNPAEIPDEDILQIAAIDPTMGKELRAAKDAALKKQETEQKHFREERKYHSDYVKKAEEEADQIRSSLPKKEMSLDFARNAVETGDVGYFSLDKLADITGSDAFRTAKGAQLITAAKENLLSNLSRVSARAQNIWMEQRLNSMFPKIGQSNEANLSVLEMLEAEAAMDKNYLNEFDRLVAEDEKEFGFPRKDIKKRAQAAANEKNKEVLKRASYRLKEIEEQEKGIKTLKQDVGKNVIKGTPLTLSMAKLYKDKFGDKALSVAEKNGYYIPSVEEFQTYKARPSEYREGL